MKLMTLNTHSLVEPDYANKKEEFIKVIEKEQPDLIALQEVNQSINAKEIKDEKLFIRCSDFNRPVRMDNHALAVVEGLRKLGICYYWTWISAKIGYDKYDEGMAILSKKPIVKVEQHLISQVNDYTNWKTRRMLGVQLEGSSDWFYTVHMGWWNDTEEPFKNQWDKIETVAKSKKDSPIWLMGDFNSPDDIMGEGYQLICNRGWMDTYHLAYKKDNGITVEEEIDGWKDSDNRGCNKKEKRLDYIFCNKKRKIKSSYVFCNGKAYPIVSDHYGVYIEVE